METIKVLYVDDNTDPYISQYLYEEYGYEGANIEYLISDKKVTVSAGKEMKGTDVYPVYIAKKHRV